MVEFHKYRVDHEYWALLGVLKLNNNEAIQSVVYIRESRINNNNFVESCKKDILKEMERKQVSFRSPLSYC